MVNKKIGKSMFFMGIVMLSGVAMAEDASLSIPEMKDYKAAIQSFGVDAGVAQQAAKLAVETVKKDRGEHQTVEDNAFASLPADFLDASPYSID